MMRGTRCACAVLLCAAAPGILVAEEPEDEEDEDAEELVGVETIELTGEAPLVSAAAPPAEVTREEIRVLPGARGDAIEAIRNLPGVAFASQFDGAAGDLVIRGTSGTDSWYSIDGVAIPTAMHFGGLTTVVPVEMIEAIELMPGGFDVAYGHATGGVVEIRTRRPRSNAWGAATEISFIHASAFGEGPITDDLSVAASVRRSFIDALIPLVVPDDSSVGFTRAPSYTDAQLRLDWRASPRHQLSLLGLYSEDGIELLIDEENPNDPVFTGAIGTRDRFWRAIATSRYDGSRLDARTTLAYGVDLEWLGLNDTHFLDVVEHDLSGREDLRLDLGRHAALRAGADVHSTFTDLAARMPLGGGEGAPELSLTMDPTLEIDDELASLDTALYLAADLRPLERLSFTPGVRVDRYGHIDDIVIQPRLSAQLDAGDGVNVRASVGRFSRPHSAAEQIPTHLEAETAIQASAGVDKRLLEGLRVQATVFASWLDDLAIFDPMLATAEEPLAGYVTRGTGTAGGVELLAELRRDDVFGWIAYTYARSRRVDGPGGAERMFDVDQPHNLVAAASWRWGRWRFGGRFRLASGVPDTPVLGAVYLADLDVYRAIYGPTNSARLAGSHQLDLRVDRRFAFKGWSLSAFLDVTNVYANPRVLGWAYAFDYRERQAVTDVPVLPSIGLRGEI